MEQRVKQIVKKWGGYRESDIMSKPHTLTRGTWNSEHKVVYVTEKAVQEDGYSNGFAVDLVTKSICG